MKIPEKYVNEVEGGSEVDDLILDDDFKKSILCVIK